MTDPKAVELAEHFLQNAETEFPSQSKAVMVDSLAKAIQGTVESWFAMERDFEREGE